jgi:hypothetical protein
MTAWIGTGNFVKYCVLLLLFTKRIVELLPNECSHCRHHAEHRDLLNHRYYHRLDILEYNEGYYVFWGVWFQCWYLFLRVIIHYHLLQQLKECHWK